MEYLSGYSMYKILGSYVKSTETQKKLILEPLCCLLKSQGNANRWEQKISNR